MTVVKKYRVAAAFSFDIQPTVLERFPDQAGGFKTKTGAHTRPEYTLVTRF